ncbi:VOC family protein [Psychroserpens sp. NJDZ02]|uniref:VOC family protein n=1 Tax=Psychroserpens sp. NJDZ02 TaxID=2570561 RepID=UPI0010A8A076|nr:VOC family protein [Psychroserpens sp. NJDZ02]QCE42085.1 VOC family protein [Psychroserpens sp. NJDZ02]
MKIQELIIFTNRLTEQKQFYSEVLGLKILDDSKTFVVFDIGQSNLKIVKRTTITTPYHFAINIPSNKEKEALNWLKERVDVLKMNKTEIQYFQNWNAKAVYFYDIDHNIVELIARKNLNNKSSKAFNQNSFLEISEIGIPTTNIKKDFDYLNKTFGLSVYDGGFDKFCAVGTETGLFVLINKNIKGWYPMDDKAFSSDFELEAIIDKKKCRIEYSNEQIKAKV